jgi:uncharacterized protein YjiS (DUF1127 family)
MTVITDERLTARAGAGRLGRARPLGSILAAAVMGAAETLMSWQERLRQRRHLEALDDRLLKDIGLSRADVRREVDKPFWQW